MWRLVAKAVLLQKGDSDFGFSAPLTPLGSKLRFHFVAVTKRRFTTIANNYS